jgi:hypothetical protein
LIASFENVLEEKKTLSDYMFNGYLSSYGFLNDEVYYEKVESSEALVNYRNLLFVICPKLNSEFHDEFKKSQKNFYHLSKLNYDK